MVLLHEKKFVLDSESDRASLGSPEAQQHVKVVLSDDEVKNDLCAFENLPDESIAQLPADEAQHFGKAVLKVLANVSNTSALQWVLQLVEDVLLANVPSNAQKAFSAAATEKDLLSDAPHLDHPPTLDISPFVKLTSNPDARVQGKALYIASLLISVSGAPESQASERKAVLSLLSEGLADGINNVVRQQNKQPAPQSLEKLMATLQALSVVLRDKAATSEFVAREGFAMLVQVVEGISTLSKDTQYSLMMCIWMCLFDQDLAKSVGSPEIRVIADVLRGDARLNVVRLCVSSLRTLLSVDPEKEQMVSEELIELKAPRTLAAISEKPAFQNDPEFIEDVDWITDTLKRNFKVLTTFERHHQELLSGKLSWNMIHEEMFWKENARFFQHNNFNSVKLLVGLLKSSEASDTTKAVACSDIGFFVQYFPNGKLIVEKEHGKDVILTLLGHENPEIKKHALSACSKIMITNWETFNKAI